MSRVQGDYPVSNPSEKDDNFLEIQSFYPYETLWTIWYHLYNLKNIKNTHGGASLLVKLQTEAGCFCELLIIITLIFKLFVPSGFETIKYEVCNNTSVFASTNIESFVLLPSWSLSQPELLTLTASYFFSSQFSHMNILYFLDICIIECCSTFVFFKIYPLSKNLNYCFSSQNIFFLTAILVTLWHLSLQWVFPRNLHCFFETFCIPANGLL